MCQLFDIHKLDWQATVDPQKYHSMCNKTIAFWVSHSLFIIATNFKKEDAGIPWVQSGEEALRASMTKIDTSSLPRLASDIILYNHQTEKISEKIKIMEEVGQGDTLSPEMFAAAVEIFKRMNIEAGINVNGVRQSKSYRWYNTDCWK